MEGVNIWCDGSTGVLRPWVPEQCRHAVFTHVHGLAHAGKRDTSRLVSARFVWPGLAADVREWCRQCTSCQRAKVLVQEQAMVEKMPMPSARFSHVHCPCGPDGSSASHQGWLHLFTMVVRSTRWPEAVPLKSTAEAVLDVFVDLPGQVQRASGHHFRQGCPVYLLKVVFLVKADGGQAHHPHCFQT